MALPWPGVANVVSNASDAEQEALKSLVQRYGEAVEEALTTAGIPLHASPLWRPWNLLVVRYVDCVLCAFSTNSGGMSEVRLLAYDEIASDPESFRNQVVSELGRIVDDLAILPLPAATIDPQEFKRAALAHVGHIEKTLILGKLGDISNVRHLEPQLRQFLADHPDPSRNVFVMMRFLDSERLDEALSAIRTTLKARGFNAVRADDREYTDELWSNIEVYMTGCQYGIAIFEDIEVRDFNPNVSLELGYMLGRGKRCLLLKENRLPVMPADVAGRLYKPFDAFRIDETVTREVGRWIDVDLGLGAS